MPARRHGWGEATTNQSDHSDDQLHDHRHGSNRVTTDGSVSTHSGVFADEIDDRDHHDTQATRVTDQKILDNARFGLATVNLHSGQSATRRASTNAATGKHGDGSIGGGNNAQRKQLSRRSSDLASSWAQRIGQLATRASRSRTAWKASLARLGATLHLLDALYLLFSVPLRVGFFLDPWNQSSRRETWTHALSVFTTIDLMGVLLRTWFSRQELLTLLQRMYRQWSACCPRRVRPVDKPRLFSMLRASFVGDGDHAMSFRSQISGLSGRGDRVSAADALPFRSRRAKSSKRFVGLLLFGIVLDCVPIELVFIVAIRNYNLLHLVGVLRFVQALRSAPQLFAEVVMARYRHLPAVQALSFSTIATIASLIMAGMYLVHMAASGYMFVAHWQCGLDFLQCTSSATLPGTWVQRDRLERGTLWRKYVRSLYWGSKTVTTLGQGDAVPATRMETAYRVLVQFVSGLWATAILTAYSFYFSRKDAKMKTNLTTRLEQATRFLATRHLPNSLTLRVRTYFEYMQRTRFGVEEELTLQALPTHYHVQCLNYVKFRSLQRVAMFKNRDGAFLRSILARLEKDYFAPSQVVLSVGDIEEMFVVASGEINVLDASRTTVSRLTPGNAHAERALFMPWATSPCTLVAETHCEVWVLHHGDFRTALKNHFSKLKFAGIMTSSFSKMGGNAATSGMSSAARKFQVPKHHGTTSNLLRKMSNTDLTGTSWRLPQSQFQRTWRHAKCVLLLLTLYEVPYHIAFQRGFGLLTPAAQPTSGAIPHAYQLMDFAAMLLVETFFYVDWYLRARVFCRYVMGAAGTRGEGGGGSNGATESYANFGLLKDTRLIFRHYLENENVWMDVLQQLPLPLVWDVLPKHLFSSRVVYVARFVRVLRLLRLQNFHALLRSIMIDHALPPSKRMLVYVVIFCTATAHFAACVFFLVGDFDEFRGGLPVGGVRPQSMTAFECLQDTTLFQNCTWYQYDRSTYNIDAPFLRALQWSIVLQSTVGFGEIMSFSSRECVVGCVWIFLGANICYCTGCVLSSVLAQLNIQHSIQHERMEEINLALVNAPNVSEHTKVVIRAYYATKWQLNGSAQQDDEILAHLPRSIRQQVQDALHATNLQQCYLFASFSDDETSGSATRLLRELAQLVQCEIFLKGIMVIREGHTATEFFVLQSGEVELLLPPLASDSDASSLFDPTGGSVSLPVAAADRRNTVAGVGGDTGGGGQTGAWKSVWRDLDSSRVLSTAPRGVSLSRPSGVDLLSHSQSRNSVRESMVASARTSAIYSRAMKLSMLDLRLPLLRRRISSTAYSKDMIPISILERHDCFGEESLAPRGLARTYQFSVRVVASVQVAVIRRRDLFAVAARFPLEFKKIDALLDAKARRDAVLLRALQQNFLHKSKIARRLGIPKSLYVDRTKLAMRIGRNWLAVLVVDPEDSFARWWYRLVGAILVYNFYVVIFRIAFLPRPRPMTMALLTAADYVCDCVLYADIVLKWFVLGFVQNGQKVLSRAKIRERYATTWFQLDCWSMLPTFYYGENLFLMTLCRLPRILRSPQLLGILDDIHRQIQERFLRSNNTKLSGVFDLFRFVLIFLSTAHYVGSLYYLLGRLQLELGIADVSWISVDIVLLQSPQSPAVHYMRSLYWCLSTFTVDCFGDIVARNFLETVFSMATCILGWIFVGQVIGRINVLMMSLDKEAKQHHMRIEHFDQYAAQRRLPNALRHRAVQCLTFKSECLIPLRLVEIFRDLPKPLRVHLFHEMYAPLLTPQEALKALPVAWIEAIANALYLEIYLPNDVIYECGREGTTLFLMKQGCAEVYAPRSNMVFAAIETGMLFGECAFFIPGAKRLASTRAVRSCQVLQLDRRQWNHLWPLAVRKQVESQILEVVAPKYRENARAYLSIAKNFFIKNENARPPRSISQRTRLWRRRSLTPRRNALLTLSHDERSGGETVTRTATPAGIKRKLSSFSELIFGVAPSPIASTSTTDPSAPTGNQDVSSTGERERTQSRDSFKRRNSMASRLEATILQLQSSLNDVVSQTTTTTTTATGSRSATPVDRFVPSVVDTRPLSTSSTESPRRKSSLTAFAEVLGLRDATTTGKLPPLVSVLSGRQLVPPLSKRASFGSSPLGKLSSATQLQWKRHEKRLAAIRMFRVGVVRVENDLTELPMAAPASIHYRRRKSLPALPSFVEKLDSRRMWLRGHTAPRRFSVCGSGTDLRKELLGFETFESEPVNSTTTEYLDPIALGFGDPNEEEEEHTSLSQGLAASLDASGSFTLAAFLRELMRRPRVVSSSARRRRGPKITPVSGTTIANRVPHEIWVPQPTGPEMFREDSRFRQTWSALMLLVTLHYAVVVPFRACFFHDHMDNPQYRTAVVATFAIEYVLTDLVCVLDFVLHRHHFEFIEAGERVAERQRIADHYWRDGTCVFDLVSLFPLELVALAAMYAAPPDLHLFSAGFFTPEGVLPVWRTLAFARGNRSIRAIVHLHSLSDCVQRYLLYELKVAWLRPSVAYLVRLALDFALGTHWIACLFYGASYLLHVDGMPSWLTTPGMLVFDDSCATLQDVSIVPVSTKYLRSFHFSIGAVTTVCYGDILPMNALETAATIVVIMLSVGLFSMLSGGFFKYFEMEFGQRADYEEKVRQVGQLMVFHQFPSRMWKQMQVFFALAWQESRGMHEDEMLRGLTVSMRHEIASHVHANLLKHVRLLGSCDTRFAHALLAVLQHELFVRNDVILQRGDRGRSMYIIESGLVSIRRPESKPRKPTLPSPTAAKHDNHQQQQPEQQEHQQQTAHHDPQMVPPSIDKASSRLRSSKSLIRDVKAAAVAALAESRGDQRRTSGIVTTTTTAATQPVSPSDAEMLQAMRAAHNAGNGRGPEGTSTGLKLQVVPKMLTSRSASKIFAPDLGSSKPKPSSRATPQMGSDRVSNAPDVKFVKGPFDYFGERSLLFGTPRAATCVALCACSLYALTLEKYEKLLEQFPQYRQKNIHDWVLSKVRPIDHKRTGSMSPM